MYPRGIRDLQADALFASTLQPSDPLSVGQIRQAITVALGAYGGAGGAGRVAQEFGDHPETAADRMRWARASVAPMDRQPVPGIRRVPAAGGSVRGGHGAAETAGNRVMDDGLIRVCAVAARAAGRRMTPRHLKALHDSVEQASCLPSRFDWDRKAAAHAEIVSLLASTTGDPAPSRPTSRSERNGQMTGLLATTRQGFPRSPVRSGEGRLSPGLGGGVSDQPPGDDNQPSAQGGDHGLAATYAVIGQDLLAAHQFL
jgi:hypothetical protein